MLKNPFTKTLINIILVLLVIFLFSLTKDFLGPIYKIIIFLLSPLILSIYLFYAFRPLRDKITQWTKRPTLAAVLTFILFIIITSFLFVITFNMLYTQTMVFFENIDFDQIQTYSKSPIVQKIQDNLPIKEITQQFETWLRNFSKDIPGKIRDILGNIGSFSSIALLVILGFFYLLKDEKLLVDTFDNMGLGQYQEDIKEIFSRIHHTLESYISAQILVAFILGILMFIGYLIIGVDYAISLAMIAMLMNFVPFIGPFLGAAPAVLVALTISPSMVLKVVIVSIVVQQAEGNLITPNIMGRKLDIHPFVVIIAVMVCINLFGLLGALIASPLYMVIKILIEGLQKIHAKKKKTQLQGQLDNKKL